MEWEWRPWSLDGLKGIEPYEVMQALAARHVMRRWTDDGQTLVVLAGTPTGRRLVIALYEDIGAWVVIGARDMTQAEAKAYERWIGGRS